MKQLFAKLREYMEQGRECVLVTIIASSGSTPRGAGSRMLVTREGIACGTIGGGAVEYRAMQTAQEAIEKKASYTKGFTLTRNQVADIGMVCGGDVTVYFQYVNPQDKGVRDICGAIEEALGRDEDMRGAPLLHRVRQGPGHRRRRAGGTALLRKGEGTMERLIICVGGHVSLALAHMASILDFDITVIDDREEFANQETFPQAAETVVGDLERISDYIAITERDYVCVMTRGHQFDYYVQRQALAAKPRYIGVMGSRSKIKVTTEKLMADGFSEEEIGFCHMPIGTRILAETPAEIAVSIAGELIEVRAESMGKR